MLLLRSVFYFLGTSIAMIAVVVVGLLFFFLPLKQRYKILSKWALFNIWWLQVVCNIKLRLIGEQNIPLKPCVIIANHQSTWETFAFQRIFPHQTWVLKQELLLIPLFGWGIALLKPIIINRGDKFNALKKIIKQGKERLEKGIFVIIFPEGTRQPYKKLGDYQKGAVAVAKAGKSDLLPIYHNAGRLWAKGGFIKYPGVITVVIAPAINVEGKSATVLIKQIKDWTQQQADFY